MTPAANRRTAPPCFHFGAFRAVVRPRLALRAVIAAGAIAGAGVPGAAARQPEAEPQITPACEASLVKEVAVAGLNPVWVSAAPMSKSEIPSLGFATADMAAAIDPTVGNYMNEFGIAGGAVALTYRDKLIFAKSYGYIQAASGAFAEPDSRYRWASVSKSLTAMGVLKLVHDGKVKLDTTPFPFANVPTIIGGGLGNLFVPGTFNSELASITVDDLLHHAGGWDRNVAPDLTGYNVLQALAAFETSRTGAASGPPDCTNLLSYVESQPLQFAPGTETHYSNVGFCALSEVIREYGGASYIDYLTANVLTPLGMTDTALGSTPIGEQLDRESTYYDTTDPSAASLFPPYLMVTAPYSSIGAIESQEGAGAIVSTAIDLAHFAGAIASGKLPDLTAKLHPGWPRDYYLYSGALPSYECSNAIPPYPASAVCPTGWSDAWEMGHWAFGMGWDQVIPDAVASPLLPYDNNNFIKDGGYPGTVSSLAATADGYGFAAVFNTNDNTVPSPQSQIFWPSCASGTAPQPAATAANCALEAAYNHAAAEPWHIDFSPQYAGAYTAWMSGSAFTTYLAAQKTLGFYPSRIEGRALSPTNFQYRARLAKGAPQQYLYGKSCASVLAAVKAAPAATPLVSLQRFSFGGGPKVYQAVWAAPLPALP